MWYPQHFSVALCFIIQNIESKKAYLAERVKNDCHKSVTSGDQLTISVKIFICLLKKGPQVLGINILKF